MHVTPLITFLGIAATVLATAATAGDDLQSFDLPELDKLLAAHADEIQSPDDLVKQKKYLPAAIRERRTYAFSNESIQKGDVNQPREIFFGPKLLMTFRKGTKHIEVIRFEDSPPPARYTFHYYLFKDGKLQPRREVKPVEKSEVRNCFGCHTSGRPIMSDYNTWCGFYGGHDDMMFGEESRKFRAFLETQEGEFRKSPYLYETDLSHKEAGNSEKTVAEMNTLRGRTPFKNRPNLLMTRYLARQNAQVVADQVQRSPLYPRYKYALLFLANCPGERQLQELEKSVLPTLFATQTERDLFQSLPNRDKTLYFEILRKMGLNPEDTNLGALADDQKNLDGSDCLQRIYARNPKPSFIEKYEYNGGGESIHELVSARLLADLPDGSDSLKGKFEATNYDKAYVGDAEALAKIGPSSYSRPSSEVCQSLLIRAKNAFATEPLACRPDGTGSPSFPVPAIPQ